MNPFETLQTRGFVHQHTDEGTLRRALDTPLVFYTGFDPSAASLHVGHLVPVMGMANLVRAGHRGIGVVGGGTMMIGDPSGRDSARDMLTAETIATNKGKLAQQLARFGVPELVDNAEWIVPLNYIEFLREIGSQFSVNRMMATEGVRNRLERNQGLSFIEFNYPLLQAYDFLMLYRRYGCVLQCGGGDQWFNIVSGVDLIRRLEGAEVQALTYPLLTTATGAKMGKTAAGAVWLDAELLRPYDFYQYWVNIDDRDITRFLLLFTFVDSREVAEIATDFRAAKRRLAWEVTALVHGDVAAHAAADAARVAFAGGMSDSMPTWHARFPVPLVDVLVGSGLAKSKSEARRLVDNGGVSIGEARVDRHDLVLDGPAVVWAGKKRAVRVAAEPA